MSPFIRSWAHLRGIEGGRSDHPDDPGGDTMFGVTEAVARANGYTGPMSDLPAELATEIAKRQYWDVQRLDDVAAISERVAYEVFEAGFNMGIGTAGKFLQRALNTLNRGERDYRDIAVDGVIGPMTVFALRQFARTRGTPGLDVLLRALNALQGARYVEIAERREASETFLYGWLLNRVSV